jgi:hypothetical protein
MALEVCIVFDWVNIPSCFIFILLRIATEGAAEVVEICLDPLKFLQA